MYTADHLVTVSKLDSSRSHTRVFSGVVVCIQCTFSPMAIFGKLDSESGPILCGCNLPLVKTEIEIS